MIIVLAITIASFLATLYAIHKFFALTDARGQRALAEANARRDHELRVLAAEAALEARAPERTETRKIGLPVATSSKLAGKCGTCVHFDVELGQREMKRNPSFVAAASAVPPWRMGRTLKLDEKGDPLPIEQQGVTKEMLALEWTDMGACTCPSKEEQVIKANIDTCEEYTRASDAVRA